MASEWYVLTYDIDKRHSDVKSHLLRNGFSACMNKSGKSYKVPNTTVFTQATSTREAMSKFYKEVSALDRTVKVMKLFACILNGQELDSDELC